MGLGRYCKQRKHISLPRATEEGPLHSTETRLGGRFLLVARLRPRAVPILHVPCSETCRVVYSWVAGRKAPVLQAHRMWLGCLTLASVSSRSGENSWLSLS